MTTLKQIIQKPDSLAGRRFDLFIQILILLSMLAYAVETLPALSDETKDVLESFEIMTLGVFTVEYLLRVYFSSPRRAYVFSVYGIIDLLSILPFLLTLTIDLRSIRLFRLLRLFRILKLTRYNAAIRRFHLALKIAKEEVILFLGATSIILFIAAVGIYLFENEAQPDKFTSVFHSLWWAVATLTTVGYGDVYPITPGGKVFTFLILLIGLGVVSVPAGLVASALAKARQIDDQERQAKLAEEGVNNTVEV